MEMKAVNKDSKSGDKKVTKEVDTDTTKDTHAYMVLGTRFEIDKRYEIIDPIGSGAYGVVVAAKDTMLPEADGQSNLVAIKKIVKAFEHRVFSLRTYRELKI
jgi:serine/threonine protein kinase